MAIKILLLGPRLRRNLGGPSLLPATIKVLNRFFKDAQYVYISPTNEDLSLDEYYHLPILAANWKDFLKITPSVIAKAWFGMSVGSNLINQLVGAFSNTDLVIDIWGIAFYDGKGSKSISGAFLNLHLLLAKILRKPVIKYTADLGPFKKRLTRILAKFYLQNTVDFILARNDITRQRLNDINISKPILVCPDTAFLLDAESSSLSEVLVRWKAEGPIIGLSVSHVADRNLQPPGKYPEVMAALADVVVETLGAKIILLPNEYDQDKKLDDLHIAQDVLGRMACKQNALIIKDEFTAPQIKGIIKIFDVVVTARYHTTIASLSQCIPVLVIGWHTKYNEVLRLVGQQRYMISAESLGLESLKELFFEVWNERERIRDEINGKLPDVYKAIYRGGKKVAEFYSKR